jgi:hypothetical protein
MSSAFSMRNPVCRFLKVRWVSMARVHRSSGHLTCGLSPWSPLSPRIRGTLLSSHTTDTPIRTCVCPYDRSQPPPQNGDSGNNGDGVDGGILRWHTTLPLDLAQPKLPHRENAPGLVSGTVPPLSRRTPLALLSNLPFHQSPYGAQSPHRAVLQRL